MEKARKKDTRKEKDRGMEKKKRINEHVRKKRARRGKKKK